MSPLPTPGDLLRAYGQPAKKRFGQNFLVDPGILDRIVASAGVTEGQRVLEIGPGIGGLTSRILATGARVHAIEADPELVAHLQAALCPSAPGLSLHPGDALSPVLDETLALSIDAVVANLPYNVATPILFRLIDHAQAPARMALMFQREVAERIVHPGAGRAFGLLAVGTQVRWETSIALHLPPGAFLPPPKVRSSVVALRRRAKPLAERAIEESSRTIARTAFQQRRKMLRVSLRSLQPDPEPWLTAADVAPDARPESLHIADFLRLAEHLPSQG